MLFPDKIQVSFSDLVKLYVVHHTIHRTALSLALPRRSQGPQVRRIGQARVSFDDTRTNEHEAVLRKLFVRKD